MIAVTCIVTEAGMQALAGEWHDLWGRLPDATPFQSPAWLLPWWSQFGTGRPVLGVLRVQGRLAGLLPTYVLPACGQDGAKLLPIGAGISDTLDALIAPDAPPDAATRLLETVLACAAEADTCDLIDLPPGAALRDAAAPPGWQASLLAGEPCPVLCLPDGTEALRQAMPATTHRKLRMNRHRAGRAGGFSVELADADTLAPMLEALFRLHAARWSASDTPGGVLADPRVREMLANAAPVLLRDGALRVCLLRLGPDIAAGCLALLGGRDRLLLYLSGFAAEHAFCSPGSLLLGAMAEEAIAEGRRELHFLRGDEAYKHAWGATDRHNATRHLVRV